MISACDFKLVTDCLIYIVGDCPVMPCKPVFAENKPFPGDERDLPQGFSGQKHEPHAEALSQRLQHLPQNMVPSCRVSLHFPLCFFPPKSIYHIFENNYKERQKTPLVHKFNKTNKNRNGSYCFFLIIILALNLPRILKRITKPFQTPLVLI